MADKTGGPAFPLAGFQDNQGPVFGMSLRDYFAAQALASLIKQGGMSTTLASRAYEIADALIAARGKA